MSKEGNVVTDTEWDRLVRSWGEIDAAHRDDRVSTTDPRQPHGESGMFQHEPGALCVVCDRLRGDDPRVRDRRRSGVLAAMAFLLCALIAVSVAWKVIA